MRGHATLQSTQENSGDVTRKSARITTATETSLKEYSAKTRNTTLHRRSDWGTMNMITKIPTKDMTREQWLAERNKSIGGSDAGTIIGFNKWSSPYALWAEKSNKITPEDISDREAVRLGNDLEQYVASRFEEATGKKVHRCNYIIRNDKYPFAHANVDRMVYGENAGLECKTTSNLEYAKLLESGKFPDTWLCQVTHYMAVTEADHWYLAALVFGKGFYWFEIKRQDSECKALMAAESHFWDMVKNNEPPAADGTEATTDAIRAIFPESEAQTVDLSGFAANLALYSELGRQIKDLEEQREAQANFIKEFMGTAEKGDAGNYSVSWKSQSRNTFDRKKYEQANGAIPQEFFKTSTSRVFRVTERS